MKRRAFTLIEMLTVVGIIAMLYAMLTPAILAARGAVLGHSAQMAMKNLTGATNLYLADYDQTFPLAMYNEPDGLRGWFGLVTATGTDAKAGLLAPYGYERGAKDPVFRGEPYLGDMTGFGYNWGYLGSETNITLDYRWFPNCFGAAREGELFDPTQTLAFATSAFYNAPWLPGGDGKVYDFGFIDPPQFWRGNPNVDFRHGGKRQVDEEVEEVTSEGRALTAFVAGNARHMGMKEMRDRHFQRMPTDQDQ